MSASKRPSFRHSCIKPKEQTIAMVMNSSQIWSPWIIEGIHSKAELGRYRIRSFSTFQKVTHFDDLTFLSTGLTRFPLEGYKEKCNTRTVLGSRYAEESPDHRDPRLHNRDELRSSVPKRQSRAG